jgi:AAA+ superfamily predicted ATPase
MRDSTAVLADSPATRDELAVAPDWQRPFQRLDSLLAGAVEEARRRFGADAGHDAFRGLYVTDEHAVAALGRPLGDPLRGAARASAPDWGDVAEHHRGWAWARDSMRLSDAELDILLIALAPEADLRYERLYGYLQDDVSRRRPTVDLVLNLISTSAAEKLAHRVLFAADGRLLRLRLIRLTPDDRTSLAPLLAHVVMLDQQVTDLLLAGGGLDRELAAYCRWSTPPPGEWQVTALPEAVRRSVLRASLAARGRYPLRIQMCGPEGSGRRAAVRALAGELQLPLLTLEVAHLPEDDEEAAGVVFRAFRQADLREAMLCIDGPSALPPGSRRRTALLDGLTGQAGITALIDVEPWTAVRSPIGLLDVEFAGPDLALRRAAWVGELQRAMVPVAADLGRTLADRFSFGPDRIGAAVASAVAAAGQDAPLAPSDVFAAARRQTGHRLAALARRIEPLRSWPDVVLPDETTAQLEQLCARVRLRSTVLAEWGFGRKLVRGRGVSALFTGPPGTGKTTAAELVAGELGLDLYAIDLSSVVSKYIGETEKNLEKIFSAAAEADAILMFDEADALFGKRSEVHDAHDRYANIETSYLLQRMEQYEGVAILATNLRENLDEAFTRRLQFIIDFPFPDERLRAGIWRVSFPPEVPMAKDVDLAALGRDFRLSGAGIANAALHAAYLAAARGHRVDVATVHEAVRREFRKMGRVPPDVLVDPGGDRPC